MRILKSGYIALLITVLILPCVMLLCAPASGWAALFLGPAVLVNTWIADSGEDNPLYEKIDEQQAADVPEREAAIPIYAMGR